MKKELNMRPCVAGIQPYQPGKPVEEVERELGIKKAVKLASNENPLGPSPLALQALHQATRQAHIYPDGSSYHLRQALAAFHKIPAEEFLLGNGSNELLILLGQAFLEPGDEVLTSQDSFSVYGTVAQLMNAGLVTVPTRDFTFDLAALAAGITAKTKIIFIANPNNPTGTVVRTEALKTFIDQVPAGCLVVLDEAYYEYADPDCMGPTLAWAREKNNLVVLRTFSKVYGLAGLRVGYGVASAEVRDAIERVRAPFNVNSLAQAAAVAALKDRAHLRTVVSLARRERRRVEKALKALGFTTAPSQANFIYALVPDRLGMTGRAFYEAAMRLGVIIRPFAGASVRITLGTEKENDKLLKAVKTILKA
jgi:histidinol-phosphate aminotransferase